jgi:hypothetical protein
VTGRDFEKIIQNNSMVPQTPWQGPPSPALDAAWQDLWLSLHSSIWLVYLDWTILTISNPRWLIHKGGDERYWDRS